MKKTAFFQIKSDHQVNWECENDKNHRKKCGILRLSELVRGMLSLIRSAEVRKGGFTKVLIKDG